MKPLAEIVKLNQTRYGLDFDGQKAIEKLEEEILEEFKPHFESDDIESMVDDLGDVIVTATGELTKIGIKYKELPTRLNRELEVTQTTLEKLTSKLDDLKKAIFVTDNQASTVNLLHDISLIAAEGILELKYQPTLVLKQIVHEISSRQQDPIQAQAWATGNKQPGEKWKKFKDQDESTLYTADFSTCKIK